ncbi:hypothetical protein EVG20_g10154 [Dentipellis fragilis]|uniref:Carboxypeptidase n=1 Tax=Dentipellis fragilis TaxID=205917 RepID=A0A4Y9XT77_9AGAM|nr:hypothetical protein EVG20_g10154 [Dentipellis fragilis]
MPPWDSLVPHNLNAVWSTQQTDSGIGIKIDPRGRKAFASHDLEVSHTRRGYLLALGLTATAAYARQQPLPMMPPASGVYDAGLFTPVESLSVLSVSEYTTLSHPFFPGVSARIKKTEFCDPTVSSYTGYIDISEAKHLFFYFFESRSNPDKDDVIFWTNGGPGCSSALGLFMELGPCRVANSTTATYHPESWNSNANVFFIDQPVNVGFSYSEYGEHVDTTEEAAEDIAAFIVLFFENFPAFKGRALHMAGESYGGRYIPLFSAAIYDQNAALVEAGITPINLTSAIIGNGYTDQLGMMLSYYDVTCTSASLPPIISISSCVRMKKALPRCEKALKAHCADSYDSMNCEAAWNFCSSEIISPFDATGINAYDLSKQCTGAVKDTLCYPETKFVFRFSV